MRPDYSQWEIGEQPQLAWPHRSSCAYVNYSQWEIGEQPQHQVNEIAALLDYSQWEIGEQPQLLTALLEICDIIANGRSGSNRNRVAAATERCFNYSQWEIGEQPQRSGSFPDSGSIIANGRSGSNRNV